MASAHVKKIDRLNSGLLVLSAALAYFLPFELFLISYVILGPLHYITEINWLDKKNYFLQAKKEYWWMVLLAVFAAAFYIMSQMPEWLETWIKASPSRLSTYLTISEFMRPSIVILAAVLASIGLVLIKSRPLRLLWVLFAIAMGLLIPILPPRIWIIVLFVPTLIHTYFFTLAFMSFGGIKSSVETWLLKYCFTPDSTYCLGGFACAR